MVSCCWLTPPHETLQHSQVGLAQSLMGSLLFSHGCWCPQDFVCGLYLCIPQSCGSPVIKSLWSSSSDSLGILSPFAPLPRLGSLLWGSEPSQQWENALVLFSLICGSPTWWVWDLIWSWLHPSYHLIVAASSSFDMRYLFFFWWVPASFCW